MYSIFLKPSYKILSVQDKLESLFFTRLFVLADDGTFRWNGSYLIFESYSGENNVTKI